MAENSDYNDELRRELKTLTDDKSPMRQIVVNIGMLLVIVTSVIYTLWH